MSLTKAKKRFGQHFLADRRVAEKIVDALEPESGENVVEIGAGRGELTEILLDKGCQVTAIELDHDLVPLLKSRFDSVRNLNIIEKDFLGIASEHLPETFKLIGNIPYNITGPILEKLFELRPCLSVAVLTVQTEVAERLTARPGTRAYGSLSVIMAAGFDARALFKIRPGSFSPPPEILSTVIRLRPVAPAMTGPENFERFKFFVRGCFRHKRKTLANSMQAGLKLPKNVSEALIEKIGRLSNVRAEQLSFGDYVKLHELWQNQR